jgi:hypothetical protein
MIMETAPAVSLKVTRPSSCYRITASLIFKSPMPDQSEKLFSENYELSHGYFTGRNSSRTVVRISR